MTTPAFEAFLARLFVNTEAREQFLADPRGEARRAGLGPEETEWAAQIDPVGLGFAARSFQHKNRKKMSVARTGVARIWWSRLRAAWRGRPSLT
jgi:hypothetical protein